MVSVEFVVDKKVLARAIIYKNKLPCDYCEKLSKKYLDYSLLKNDISANITDDILLDVIKQPFFNTQYMLSCENCERIKKYFKKKEKGLNKFLNDITNTNLRLPKYTIFILAPNLNLGETFKPGKILYGNQRGVGDPNFDVVNIVFLMLYSFFKKNKTTLALIKNITFIELARHLNKSYQYYTLGADETQKQIYPFWNLFINRNKRAILLDKKYTGFEYDINKYEQFRPLLSNLNVFDFIKWLENQ